jgi:uncharacterized protein (DUF58 family)
MKDKANASGDPSSFIPHPSSFTTPHPSSFILHPSPWRRWRNAILGTLLVLTGLLIALLTLFARQIGEPDLARTGAIASLVFVVLILVLVVPPLTRSAFAEVSRIEFPVEVTRGGVVFVAIAVIVAFAAWNTGNNLLFMVFSLLISTLFVSWAAARATLRELTVSARFPDHIFAGERTEIMVTVRNVKRLLPSFSIMVEARGPNGRDGAGAGENRTQRTRPQFKNRALAYFVYVPHRAGAEQSVQQLFPKRGHVSVNGFELSTRFPFGFFRHRRRLRARDVDIVVYPKPEPVADELHLLPLFGGRLESTRRGAGHDLFSLRDYQPHDDLRHISWKATARTRRLTVREFTAEDERRITIGFDTQFTRDIDEENFRIRFERGVTQTASLIKHFIDERAEVRLILGRDQGDFSAGADHLYACLRRLALIEPSYEVAEDRWARIFESSKPGQQHSGANYVILLTTAARGSIPANIWRRAFVIYL